MRLSPPAGRFRALDWLVVCALLTATASCVKLPRRHSGAAGQTAPPAAQAAPSATPLVNINTASPAELERLPGIGRGLAARIVAHRAEYGRFRRAAHLMMVRGISARRFGAISALITAE